MIVQSTTGTSAELTENALIFRGGGKPEVRVPLTAVIGASNVNDGVLVNYVDLTTPALKPLTWKGVVPASTAKTFKETITTTLTTKFPTRPKHLLVIVNPGCGNFKGVAIYEQEVAPILALANVSAEVLITQKHGDAKTTLKTRSMEGIHGVLVVGGDGTFGDAAQGLIERAQIDAGIDLSSVDDAEKDASSKTPWSGAVTPVAPSIPIASIPGGSGNAYATVAAGVHDVLTSALHAVLGHVMKTDVASYSLLTDGVPASLSDLPSSPAQLAGFSVLMAAITNLDIVALMKWEVEMRKKWGPFRYFLYPFLLDRKDDVVLKVSFVETPALPPTVCRTDCVICDGDDDDDEDPPTTSSSSSVSSKLPWRIQTIRDKSFVYVPTSPVRHKFADFGLLPFAHVADGNLQALSFWQAPKVATMLHYAKWRVDDFFMMESSPFLITTNEMVMENEMPMVDGKGKQLFIACEETISDITSPLHVRVHRKLLKTYGMGLRAKSGSPHRPEVGVARFLAVKAVKTVGVIVAVSVVVRFVGKRVRWSLLWGNVAEKAEEAARGVAGWIRLRH